MRFNVRFREESMRFDVRFSCNNVGFRAEFDSFQTVAKAPDVEYYEGEYSIMPAVQAQTLQTAYKMLEENLVVQEIPYAEVGNLSGGVTATIG